MILKNNCKIKNLEQFNYIELMKEFYLPYLRELVYYICKLLNDYNKGNKDTDYF